MKIDVHNLPWMNFVHKQTAWWKMFMKVVIPLVVIQMNT